MLQCKSKVTHDYQMDASFNALDACKTSGWVTRLDYEEVARAEAVQVTPLGNISRLSIHSTESRELTPESYIYICSHAVKSLICQPRLPIEVDFPTLNMHLVTIAAVLSAALATAAPAAAPSSSVYATISNHITACSGKFHEVRSDRIEQWKFKLTKISVKGRRPSPHLRREGEEKRTRCARVPGQFGESEFLVFDLREVRSHPTFFRRVYFVHSLSRSELRWV